MLATFTLGLLGDAWLGSSTAAGVAYLAGSALAARYARPAALLTVVVSPPLTFFAALVCVKAATATGDVLVSAVAGVALALAETALWLFAGTLLCLVIAWFRGLPRCVGDLRRQVRHERARRSGTPTTGISAAHGRPGASR